MLWLFASVAAVAVVVIGLVVLGRETARLAGSPRPAVFDVEQAVTFIAERLPVATRSRISHEDVRWVLMADADLLEARTVDPGPADEEALVVDEDDAVARILERADASGRDLADEDVAAVLDARADYLGAIGAVGPSAGT